MISILCLIAVCLSQTFSSAIEPRIIGGQPIDINSHKYLVKLNFDSGSTYLFCSGSIISSRWIVTAAHCVFPNKPTSIKVTHFKDDNIKVIAEIKESFKHPDFNNRNLIFHFKVYDEASNDIALLKTKKEIVFDDFIKPIKLIDAIPAEYSLATIVGYGVSETGIEKPRKGNVRLYHCGDKTEILCSRRSPSRIGPGDSGGSVVINGRLAAVISSMCYNYRNDDNCINLYVNIVENSKWIHTIITES